MGLRVLFLINPTAGQGQGSKTWETVHPFLPKTGWHWSSRISGQKGDLIRMAATALTEDWDRLVVLGGDGSMHEVVNGLLGSGVGRESMPGLALIPCGSGNDWSRTWGYPRKVGNWFEQVHNWSLQEHNAGVMTYHRDGHEERAYFLNVAGLAYDAWLVKQIEAHPESKGHPLIYIWSILRYLLSYRPQQAIVRSGEVSWEGRFYTINAGICSYSGGGMRVVPHADPSSGQLALTVAGNLPLWRILVNIWRFYNGSIGKVKDVHTLSGQELVIESRDDQPLFVEADGEWKGECPCHIQILPQAFAVWAPVRSR
ncbi:MAG: diacylglycerol kinase family lipid kinase [Saprospiraceae bacterium]|nr:diacylglycerol kinase family lipid kinase [Saprospiraceae bacterium]